MNHLDCQIVNLPHEHDLFQENMKTNSLYDLISYAKLQSFFCLCVCGGGGGGHFKAT